jgi:hypothetical protein
MTEMPVWMWLSYLVGPIVTLVLGFARLWHWKKPSLLLICAALAQGGQILGYRSFGEIAHLIETSFNVSEMKAFNLTGVLFSLTTMVDMGLLLWAVFCDRDYSPAKTPSQKIT